MSHLGGGGYYGGGTHHSSSRRSRSSHSSSQPRISLESFPGSRRFVYYRNNMPHYFYADKKPQAMTRSAKIIFVLFLIPFYLVGFFLVTKCYESPKKITGDYDTQIVIKDNANILKDTTNLYQSMESFCDKTGVVPAIITVNLEDYVFYYSPVEYAFKLYEENFGSDEHHYLIVYSVQPVNSIPEGWSYETVVGDDLSSLISSKKEDEFNDILYSNLSKNSLTLSEALSTSFNEFDPLKKTVNWDIVLFASFWTGIILFFTIVIIYTEIKNKPYSQAEEILENAQERICPHCGGKCVMTTEDKCPYCGASLVSINRFNQ